MEWKTPPKPVRYKRSNTEWNEIADRLRANPNEWAKVAEDINPSTVTHIRKGRLQAFTPAGSFEASGHGRTDKGYTKELYVRFVGAGVATTASTTASTTVGTTASTPENTSAVAVDFFNDPEL